jgi:predicted transcriptional regulator
MPPMHIEKSKNIPSHRRILDRPKPKALNSDQLILEVVDMMLKYEINDVAIFTDDVQVANITFSEVANFLSKDSKSNLLYHKLNYTISSFLQLRIS